MGPAFPPVPISGLRAPSLGLGEDMPFPPWVSFQSVLFSSEGVMLRLPSSPPCFLGVRLLGAAGVGGGCLEGPGGRGPRCSTGTHALQWGALAVCSRSSHLALLLQGAGQGLAVAGRAALSSRSREGRFPVPPRSAGWTAKQLKPQGWRRVGSVCSQESQRKSSPSFRQGSQTAFLGSGEWEPPWMRV